MRFKTYLAVLLFVAVIGVLVCALPVTAASTGSGDSKVYTVTFPTAPTIHPLIYYGSISQGQYQWQSKTINYYTTSYTFDLYWGNTANSLRLRIFTPDGQVLGPYYDWSDGHTDGQVYFMIYCSTGLAQGTWYTEVYGDRVSGTQSYSI